MSTTSGIQAGVTTGSSLSGGSGSLPNDPISTLDLYGDEIFGGYSTRRLKGIFPKLLPADYSEARAAYSLRKVRSGYPDKTLPANYGDGAAVAYSLRRVNGAYNGPAIKVRRSSDDAVQDIGLTQVGGLDTTALTTFVNSGEVFTNADISSATGWTLGGNTTYNASTEAFDLVSENGLTVRQGKNVSGHTYAITIVVDSVTSGGIKIYAGGTQSAVISTAGTHTLNIVGGSSNTILGINPNGTVTCSISSFSAIDTTADGHVTTWFDQSGNGNNATNATSSQQPLIVEAGSVVTENGKPAIKFDGTADALEFTELNLGNNSWFINAVYKSTRTTLEDYFLYGALGQTRIRIYETNVRLYINNVYYSYNIGSHRNTQQLFSFEADASKGLSVYKNGTEKGTEQTIGTGYSFLPSSLGQVGSSRTIDGLVQEVIIFNSDQSDNRPFIEENINVYYDIYAQDEWDKESAIKVRRSSDDALQDIGFVGNELDTTALTTFVNAERDIFTSDFPNGTAAGSGDGSLGTTRTTLTAPSSIGGETDALQVTCDGTVANYDMRVRFTGDGQKHDVSFQYYIPSGNTIVEGITWTDAAVSTFNTKGVWTSVNLTDVTINNNILRFFASSSSGTVGIGSGVTESFYIRNLSVSQTTADGHVTTWYDQSGFGNHASNLTATQQPLIVDAGNVVTENGKAAVDFDGVDDKLGFASNLNIGGSPSIIGVLNTAAGDIAWRAGAEDYWYFQTSQIFRYRNGDFDTSWVNSDGLPIVTGSQKLIATYKNSTSVELAVDGTSIATKSSGTGTDGAFNYIGSNGLYMDGVWQELIIFTSDQSSNRRDIEWNINNHYSIYEQWNRNSALSVRRSSDDTTKQIGFDGSSNMSESEVLSFVNDASPVLDDNLGAVSAYSLRKVLTAYTGSAIKVRRSSDDELQDIGFDANGDLDTTTLLAFVGGENKVVQSENLNTTWSKSSATPTASTEETPDGDTTSKFIKLVDDNAGGTGVVFQSQNITLKAATQYAMSAYFKADGVGWVRLQANDYDGSNDARAFFNLSTGAVGTELNLDQSATMTDVGNGWYRCTIVFTMGASDTSIGYIIGLADADNDFVVDLDGTSSIFAWGMMVNQGNSANTYISTTTGIAGDGAVTTWYDQTGNSDATQTTDSEQPLVVSAGAVVTEGDRPAMSLVDGQYFDNAGVDGYSRFDFFSVSKITDTTGMFLTFSTGGGKYSWVYTQSSANTTFYSSFGTPTMYSNSVLQSISDRGDVYNAYNGHKIITTLGGDTSGWTDGKFFAYTSPFGVSGTVQEIISFDSDQSSSRLGIEGNIGRYYNITGYRDGFVTKWYDQSNNDNHLENATASQQPKIVEDGVMITENGHPAIEFNRTTEEDILSAAASFSQPVTHFFVRRITNLTNGTQVPLSYQSTTGTPWGEIYFSNLFRTHFGNYFGTFEGVEDLLLQYVIADGANSTIAYNAAEGDTGNAGSSNVSGLHVGRNSSSGTYESNVKAQELIVYQRDASAIRREIEEIINRHFRIYL